MKSHAHWCQQLNVILWKLRKFCGNSWKNKVKCSDKTLPAPWNVKKKSGTELKLKTGNSICPGIAPMKSHAWLPSLFCGGCSFSLQAMKHEYLSARTFFSQGVTRSSSSHPAITKWKDVTARLSNDWKLAAQLQSATAQPHSCPARPCQQFKSADQQSVSTGTCWN